MECKSEKWKPRKKKDRTKLHKHFLIYTAYTQTPCAQNSAYVIRCEIRAHLLWPNANELLILSLSLSSIFTSRATRLHFGIVRFSINIQKKRKPELGIAKYTTRWLDETQEPPHGCITAVVIISSAIRHHRRRIIYVGKINCWRIEYYFQIARLVRLVALLSCPVPPNDRRPLAAILICWIALSLVNGTSDSGNIQKFIFAIFKMCEAMQRGLACGVEHGIAVCVCVTISQPSTDSPDHTIFTFVYIIFLVVG